MATGAGLAMAGVEITAATLALSVAAVLKIPAAITTMAATAAHSPLGVEISLGITAIQPLIVCVTKNDSCLYPV